MYTRALEIAQGAEEAEKNLREMRTPRRQCDVAGADTTNKQEPVHQISGKQLRKPSSGCCYCCGANSRVQA